MNKIYLVITFIIPILILLSGCITNDETNKQPPEVTYELICEPVVKVTGYNYTANPDSVPYQDIHSKFADNYTGSNLSQEFRNDIIDSMQKKAEELGENSTILNEAIKVTYADWDYRPYRIPCYAEKAMYKNDTIWALAFNRANSFENGIEHIDLYFVSISTLQTQYVQGCNSTAIIYYLGCE